MKLLLQFLKPYRKLLIFTMILLFADALGALFIPTLAAEMLNIGTNEGGMQELWHTGMLMAVISLISSACAIASGYFTSKLSAHVGRDLREAIYHKTLQLSIYDFRQFGTASITTRTISDVTTIQTALTDAIQMILPVPFICAAATVLCFRLSRKLGCILLGIIAIVLIMAGVIMTRTTPLFQKLQKLLDRMSEILLENLTGVRVVRAFNNQDRENQRLDLAFAEYASTSIKANRQFANLDGLSFFFINLFVMIVYWCSPCEITAGSFQIGDISAIIEYAMMVLFYLMMAQMIILTLPRALECCERIQEVLESAPEIKDEVDEDPEMKKNEEVLAFHDVSFRFADAQENTLNHLDFVCRRGETTAIIGSTGSGKSTIASLILRFHDAGWGRICLNGVDIRKMKQSFLRDHIAYVQQKAWLFSGTISSNLRYSDENASEEEMRHALNTAQASEFVDALQDGMEHPVAQGGTNYSGGQRQRLSIARALVKRPELYIFDDSFSALDFKTDAALRKALAEETKDAAVLIIAQRISTIAHAEQIIVLDEGNMAGVGRHEQLLKTCAVYKQIYDSQTKEAR